MLHAIGPGDDDLRVSRGGDFGEWFEGGIVENPEAFAQLEPADAGFDEVFVCEPAHGRAEELADLRQFDFGIVIAPLDAAGSEQPSGAAARAIAAHPHLRIGEDEFDAGDRASDMFDGAAHPGGFLVRAAERIEVRIFDGAGEPFGGETRP